MRDILETTSYLSADADIFYYQILESAVMIIQERKENMLTLEEIFVVEPILTFKARDETKDKGIYHAQKVLIKRKVPETHQKRHIDIRFLLFTSNLCAGLFSIARYTTGKSLRRFLPHIPRNNFLTANSTVWQLVDIQNITARNGLTHVNHMGLCISHEMIHRTKIISFFCIIRSPDHLTRPAPDTRVEHMQICKSQTFWTFSLHAVGWFQYG